MALSKLQDRDDVLASGKTMARILYLTKVFPYPPAVSGDAVYSRGIISALKKHCMLTVLCADSGSFEEPSDDIAWNITSPPRGGRAGSVLSQLPLIAWKGATPDFRSVLRRLLKDQWDGIVLDNIGLAHALPDVLAYRSSHPRTILTYVSHEHEYDVRRSKYRNYKLSALKGALAKADLRKVRVSETALIRHCDVVTVINLADLEPFRILSPAQKYHVLLPGYDGAIVASRRIDLNTPRRILLLGGRRAEQKRQILLDFMAIAYDRLIASGIDIAIAGDMDDTLRQTLAKQYPKAQVFGFVDDLEPLVRSARMGVIADTMGGGFKLRLLSHVFQRLPIVGLCDAIDGLPTPEGRGYVGAPDLPSLANLVMHLIDDTDRLTSIQDAAFEDCSAAFSWDARGIALLAAIADGSSQELV